MQPNTGLINALLLAWTPVVVVLFLRLDRRLATLIAVVGGTLLLPNRWFTLSSAIPYGFTQQDAIGLALGLGMLARERGALFRSRPRRVDFLVLAYTVFPIVSRLSSGLTPPWDTVEIVAHRGFGLLVPYAAARRYLGDVEGARKIGIAIAVATLAYVPVCVFETVMGPNWYLGGLIYGVPYGGGMVNRLGGWRPEGFFFNGLTLASWMAMAAVAAVWLWLSGSWSPRRGPSWWPALVLVATSIACRGVYGYINLALGIGTALLTRWLRTRWILVGLALVAPAYFALRISGVWDAQSLVRVADLTGRGGTVSARLTSEDDIIERVVRRHPVVGYGGYIWHAASANEPPFRYWPDGAWLPLFWSGGLVGLTLHLAVLELVPAGLLLARSPKGLSESEARSPVWGLVLILTLNMIDALHNNSTFPPMGLAVGSLVGVALGEPGLFRGPRGRARPHARAHTEAQGDGRTLGSSLVRLAVALVLLGAPELVGYLTGNPPWGQGITPEKVEKSRTGPGRLIPKPDKGTKPDGV